MPTKSRQPRKTYANVADMLRATGASKETMANVENAIAARELITLLIKIRHAEGIKQADVAQRMGITQSAISKLENSTDDDLRIGEVKKYLAAVDMQAELFIIPSSLTLADRVKHHCFCIRDLIHHLASLTNKDSTMSEGVTSFFGEAMFNLFKMFQSAQGKITKPRNATVASNPRLSVRAVEVDTDSSERSEELECCGN